MSPGRDCLSFLTAYRLGIGLSRETELIDEKKESPSQTNPKVSIRLFSYQPIFIPKLQINFAEFPCLLYIESNRVCSTREPVADCGTEKEGTSCFLVFAFFMDSNFQLI